MMETSYSGGSKLKQDVWTRVEKGGSKEDGMDVKKVNKRVELKTKEVVCKKT